MNDRKHAAVAAKSCAFHHFGVRNSGRKLMEMEWNGMKWMCWGICHPMKSNNIHGIFMTFMRSLWVQPQELTVEQPWRSGVESPISEVNYSELTRPKRLVWKESSPKWLDISMIGIWRLVKYEITHQRGGCLNIMIPSQEALRSLFHASPISTAIILIVR